jgi:putative ABC transport system permease protein
VNRADSAIVARLPKRLDPLVLIISSLVLSLAVVMASVAAVGVFNTVLLDTRERARDVGVLKAIGMTPAQVVGAVVTSMAVTGLVGGILGIPIGVAAHRLVMPYTAEAGGSTIRAAWLDVYSAPTMALLVAAGVLIATAGALIPAGWAARTRIATVLHSE